MGKFTTTPITRISNIKKEDFLKNYYKPQLPVLLENMTDNWNKNWTLDTIKSLAGDQIVPLYDNKPAEGKEDVYAPRLEMKMAEYIDLLKSEPTELRIFFYLIKDNIPSLLDEFEYPDIGLKYFKRLPALFFGSSLSKVFMHFDIDMADNLHIHFEGHKKVLLFPPSESTALYKVPLSIHNIDKIDMDNPDFEAYPALKNANGIEVYMNHGDALYMPSGWWHYITYLDGGFSMTLRSLPRKPKQVAKMMYNVFLMRHFDNLMRRTRGQSWIDYKDNWARNRTNKKFDL